MVLTFLDTIGWLALPVLILAGMFTLSSQPITLAIVQDHFPKHRSVANGFFMAFSFICLSISAIGIGILADSFGLHQAFQIAALSGLLAAPLVFFLPPPTPGSLKMLLPVVEE
jgi:predicted MFS family arabinose efflux permease